MVSYHHAQRTNDRTKNKNRNGQKIAQRTNDPILRKFCARLTDRQADGLE